MQDFELRGILGDAYDQTTDEQHRQIIKISEAIERRWPFAEWVEEHTDAMNAGLEVVLGDTQPAEIGEAWSRAVAAEREARRRLTGAIIALAVEGISEVEIAARLGTSRPTVRKALGK